MLSAPKILLALGALSLQVLVSAQTAVDCLKTPWDPSCASFELPAATTQANLADLCKQMPYMPGCSLLNSCQSSHKTDQWCTPFSILADICAVDMPGMGSCKNYVALCGVNNSTATICTKAPMIPSFPTTKSASALVIGICTEMDMAGCERCPKPAPNAYAAECDTLGTYAILCKAMPEMSQCSTWKSMCTPSASSMGFDQSEYCAAGVGGADMNPPKMRMYFHTGFEDYVLFETWVPRSAGQYAGTWFALFFLTLFYQTIAAYRTGLDIQWAEQLAAEIEAEAETAKTGPSEPLTSVSLNSNRTVGPSGSSSILMNWVYLWRQPWSAREVRQNLIRSVLMFVETTLGYALMLVTMTFNVALFFAVILGLCVGAVVFSRQRNMVMVQSKNGAASNGSSSGCAGCG
ncbi:solute carrier family 31 (copper transporter), member 1 [Entomortierella parvispora]|uniref:Copper transport protein n=1 Tax=Entomortierella parvispora TaxID=205924 RepID=A0A9P3HJZ9_9FUNG|nr:solute carrier family 31 (copper transporter), member 1 [Entomortierella parvispora]